MKKFLILLITLILLTGCTVNSNVTVNNDNTVNERVIIIGNRSDIPSNENVDIYVNKLISAYGLNNYKRTITRRGKNVIVTLNKTYNDFCEYVNRSFFVNDQATSSKCNARLKKYEIDLKKVYKECTDCLEEEDHVQISYKLLDNNIIESNSDSKDGSYHTWSFDSEDNKSINIQVKRHFILKDLYGRFLWLSLLFVIAIISFVGFIFYKKFKNNRMDY